MQLIQLQYAVDIDRCGSITEAAKNLFVAQPNLSKSIRELEEELGITIFTRTTRGVVPTKAGKQFLASAREILQKVEDLKQDTQQQSPEHLYFRFTASPFIDCTSILSQYLNERQQRESEKELSPIWNVAGIQTNFLDAIDRLISGESDLAFLCFPAAYDRFFQQQFTKNQLIVQLLSFQPIRTTIALSHPLARENHINADQLTAYPQILLERSLPPLSSRQRKDLAEFQPADKLLYCADRDSAFTMLSQLRDSYLWAPALPSSLLFRYHLCQRSCPQAGNYRIVAVTPSHKPSSRMIRRFVREVTELYG